MAISSMIRSALLAVAIIAAIGTGSAQALTCKSPVVAMSGWTREALATTPAAHWRAQACKRAVSKWAVLARGTYGTPYASWTNAIKKREQYRLTATHAECRVTATPCKPD